MGHLWYLNVHSGTSFTWLRTRAVLYPTQLVLSWIAPAGGCGVITLDLNNCTEVHIAPSPSHHAARNDISSIAAREQSNAPGSDNIVELLCPFQLIYGDGVERLAAESARERARWVAAISDALSRATTVGTQSTRASSTSPSLSSTPSVRSLRSEQTEQTSRTRSTEGSSSTTFHPPRSEIPTTISPSVSSESFSGSASSASGPRFRTSSMGSGSISGLRTETQSVSSPRSAASSQIAISPRSVPGSQSSLSPRSETGSRSVVSSRSSTQTQTVTSSSSQSTHSRSPATQTSTVSGTRVTRSTSLRSSPSVTSDSMTEARTPTTRTETFRSRSASSESRNTTTNTTTFSSRTFTRTETSQRSLGDSVLSPGADNLASEGRSTVPISGSSRTSSTAELDGEFEPLSSISESGSVQSKVGTASSGPVVTRTGAAISPGASLVLSPPPSPRRTRSKSSRRPQRSDTPSSYESSSQSGSSSGIYRTAHISGGPRSPSSLARSPTTEVSSYTSEELTPTMESHMETSSPTRTQFTSPLPSPPPTPSSSSSRTRSEDYEVTSGGSEGLRLRRTESGSDWTSVNRSSPLVSSLGSPSSRSRRSETVSASSEGSFTASSISRKLRRAQAPARRYEDRTMARTGPDRLSSPSTPPYQWTDIDTTDKTPTKTGYPRPSSTGGEAIPRKQRPYTIPSQVAPTLNWGEDFYEPESPSSFAGSEVASEEFTTASSNKMERSSTERESQYTTASQDPSTTREASVSSERDYSTASVCTTFDTGDDARTLRASYRSLSSCPLHSDSFTTASERRSGVTARCHCKRTPPPSPLPSESSVALSTLRSITPTPTQGPVPQPPAQAFVPDPVVLRGRPRATHRRAPYTPRVSTISSGTSISSITSLSGGLSVPSVRSVPSTVAIFHNPPPTPVPVPRPPPSPVPSSVRLPFQPAPSVRSLPSSLPSPPSESTPTLSSTSRSPSIQSVAVPDVPATCEISRPASVVPTISSLTPSSLLSSRRTTPRELSRTVSSASWTESLDAPEITSEFGEVRLPSPSFTEPSQATPRIVSERAPSPTRSVTTVSWTPSSPSIVHAISPAHPRPPPSPTPSPWEPSESSVYTSVVSEEETESTIPSISYPAAPAGSLGSSPSIRSIKSPWAAETDVSFESSLLGPSPSIESVSVLPTIAFEPTPVRLDLPTPTVSSEPRSPPVTPEISTPPALPRSPCTVSAATTESTVQLRNAPRPHSPPVSAWDESSVTPSEITEYRTVSPSVVSSATRSLPTEVMRPAPLLGFPPSRSHSRAPSVASLRSFSTRASNRPSISSRLGTIVSEGIPEEPKPEPVVAPTRVSTEDIVRLRQLFSNMNEHHESKSRELASQVSQIEEDLLDLSRFVRDAAGQRRQRELETLNKRPEIVIIQVPAPVLAPPRVPVEPEPELEPEPKSEPAAQGFARSKKA